MAISGRTSSAREPRPGIGEPDQSARTEVLEEERDTPSGDLVIAVAPSALSSIATDRDMSKELMEGLATGALAPVQLWACPLPRVGIGDIMLCTEYVVPIRMEELDEASQVDCSRL